MLSDYILCKVYALALSTFEPKGLWYPGRRIPED